MNKLFKSIVAASVGVAMAIGMGVGLGGETKAVFAEESVHYTLAPATGSNNSYAGSCDVTINGLTWNVTGNAQMIPWRIGGNGITNVNRSVYSKTAMPSAITKIELDVGAASSITVNSLTLNVGTSAQNSSLDSVDVDFVQSSTLEILPSSGTEWATNSYYSFVFNVTVSGNKNKFIEFEEARFYSASPVESSVSVSLNKTAMELDLYDSASDSLTATVTAIGSATSGLTAISDDETVATISTASPVSGTPFNVVAHKEGTANIVVKSVWDDEVSATCVVTVVDSTPADFESKQFVPCTSASDLEVGYSYLITSDPNADAVKTMSIFPATNNRPAVAATVADNKINSTANMLTLSLEPSGNYWQIKTENNDGGNNYFTQGNQESNNYLKLSSTGDNWSISFSGNAAIITSQLKGTHNILRYNATNDLFSCYSSGQQAVYLWKEYSTKTLNSLSLDVDVPTKKDYVSGEHFNPDGLEVYAVWDGVKDTEHNLADSLAWEPNPLTAGTTSVTGTYRTKTVTVTGITVTAAPGSAENPYTVAQARNAIDEGTGLTNVYATGIVSSVAGYFSNKYISYFISDDGSDSVTLEIYNGLGINGANFTGIKDVQKGATVVVYGTLKKYNDTYEFGADNHLVSYIPSASEKVSKLSTQSSISYSGTSEGSTETLVDSLDREFTGVASGAGYSGWSNKKATSNAVYAGYSAGANNSIQLNFKSGTHAGIITTASGGQAKKIVVSWESHTADDRAIEIYGKNEPYESVEELANDSTKGSDLGTIVCGTSTELAITEAFSYIGIKSNGALYLSSISITWESNQKVYEDLAIRFSGSVSEELWDELDGDSNAIKGFGIMFSASVSGLENAYNEALTSASGNMANAIAAIKANAAIKYFDNSEISSEVHDGAGSVDTPDLSNGNYVWNLYKRVSNANQNKTYYAVAFIKLDNEIVFLGEAAESVSSLVSKLNVRNTKGNNPYLDIVNAEE